MVRQSSKNALRPAPSCASLASWRRNPRCRLQAVTHVFIADVSDVLHLVTRSKLPNGPICVSGRPGQPGEAARRPPRKDGRKQKVCCLCSCLSSNVIGDGLLTNHHHAKELAAQRLAGIACRRPRAPTFALLSMWARHVAKCETLQLY